VTYDYMAESVHYVPHGVWLSERKEPYLDGPRWDNASGRNDQRTGWESGGLSLLEQWRGY